MENNITPSRRPVCLITGASRGIGSALAEEFARAGYDLILTCSQSFEALCEISDRLVKNYRIECSPHQVDMGDPAQVAALFSTLTDLHVLINNAGISHIGLLHEMTPDQWHRILAVNLDACFYTCKYSIPLMLRHHSGRIINISSVWGNIGASMEVAYSASKGGLNAFTKALAKEVAPSGIRVNCIAPGFIMTEMNSRFSQEDLDLIREDIPLGIFGEPRHVADAAAFLASPSAEYITGQVLGVNGGMVI